MISQIQAEQYQAPDELSTIFGGEVASRSSIYRWYSEFNHGRSSMQDESREGHLKSIVFSKTIDAVHELILHVRHMVYREIETT